MLFIKKILLHTLIKTVISILKKEKKSWLDTKNIEKIMEVIVSDDFDDK
jgi:hypothetical protein